MLSWNMNQSVSTTTSTSSALGCRPTNGVCRSTFFTSQVLAIIQIIFVQQPVRVFASKTVAIAITIFVPLPNTLLAPTKVFETHKVAWNVATGQTQPKYVEASFSPHLWEGHGQAGRFAEVVRFP